MGMYTVGHINLADPTIVLQVPCFEKETKCYDPECGGVISSSKTTAKTLMAKSERNPNQMTRHHVMSQGIPEHLKDPILGYHEILETSQVYRFHTRPWLA